MRPTQLHVGGVLYWTIRTRDPDTQLLKDADATPTVVIVKNGTVTGDSVTITKRSATTGIYDCSYNPAGEAEGDDFTVEESAQVTGTTTAQATYSNSWAFGVVALERGTDSALLAANYTAPPTASANASQVRTELTPELARIDATVSSRSTLTAANVWEHATRSLTTFGTLVSDIWSNATRTLTAISDSSGITTLLSRILGTLAAGTHQPQTGDSFARLGAPAGASIAADIANIEGGGLTGANSILVTVRDSFTNTAIEGAKVRFFRTGEDGTQATNASGQATFTIASATWSYTVKATGYIGASGSQLVTANGTLNVSLTAQTFPSSPDPDLCDLSFVVASQSGEDLSGIVCDAKFAQGFAVTTGRLYINAIETASSNSEGEVTLRLVQGATYDITATRAGHRKTVVRVTVPAQTSAQLTTAIVI
jgi:hypothetical protein